MSLPKHLSQPILETILGHLALLFLSAAGNRTAAREAATTLLAGYRIETNEELTIAADIVSFRFRALDVLSRSVAADLTIPAMLRLQSKAIGLSREAHKSERKLDAIRRNRASAPTPEPVAATPAPSEAKPVAEQPAAEKPTAEKPTPQKPAPVAAKPAFKPTADALHKQMMTQRITENARRNQAAFIARQAAQTAQTAQTAQPAAC